MPEHPTASTAQVPAFLAPEAHSGAGLSPSSSEPRRDLERHRAETDRLRVLTDFLARPIHAHGGDQPDPDIVTAYNLAVEAALNGIRRAAMG